jgi:oligopeptide transport system substrate-binding protein
MRYFPRILFVLLSGFFLFFGGCSHRTSDVMRAASGGKKYGGTYTLNEIRGNPASLDPVRMMSKVEQDIGTNIFDLLVDLDTKLEITPELATRWDISQDGKTYTFHLRTDVVFHDDSCFPTGKGRKMTAADVKYSFERMCDPKTLTAQFWTFQDIVEGANDYFNGKTKSVSGFKLLDDSTFEIDLAKPFAPFLFHLANTAYVIPHEGIERYGKDFFQHPVGTGAFQFSYWKPDQEILLVKNPHYWQRDSVGNQLPLLSSVKFTLIKDDKTVLQSFIQGNEDEDFTIPTESFTQIVTPQKELTEQYASKYVLQHVSAMNSYFMEFLCTSKLFSNEALRRAMSFAVDRGSIVKFVLKDAPHSIADHGIVPPAFSNYPIDEVHGITFNPDSAKYWLQVAGYPNGKGAPEIKLSVYNEPRPMQIAEAVQHMWTNIGLNVSIQVMQSAELFERSEDGTLDLWLTRWYADYPEPEDFLNLLYGRLVPKDAAAKSYPNSARWNDDRFNAIFDQAIATTDEAKRMQLYAQAENIAAYAAPNIPLFYEEHYRLLQPYIRDNPLDPMDRVDLKFVWLDK